MTCQAISTAVADAMSDSTQATPPPPVRGGSGMGGRGGQGRNPKQVAVSGNCNRCGKADHYVRDCPERNMYWDTPPDGTEDTATMVNRKKGAKLDVTMSYCSM